MVEPLRALSYFFSKYDAEQTSQNWFIFNCPFCDCGRDKLKCAVRPDWEVVKCWECGYKSFVTDFVATVENLSNFDAAKLIFSYEPADVRLESKKRPVRDFSKALDLPVGFTGLMDSDGVLGRRARSYLNKRGFDIQKLAAYGFGYCSEHHEDIRQDYFGYIIVPVKSKGRLIYYLGRDFMGLNPKYRYKNPPVDQTGIGKADCLFNEDAIRLHDTVFITEGWADAVTIGENAVSTQGWKLSKRQVKLLRQAQVKNLVFVPDVGSEQGETFYRKALTTAKTFIHEKKVYVLDTETLAEHGKDANDWGRSRVLKLFENSEPFTYGSLSKQILCRH